MLHLSSIKILLNRFHKLQRNWLTHAWLCDNDIDNSCDVCMRRHNLNNHMYCGLIKVRCIRCILDVSCYQWQAEDCKLSSHRDLLFVCSALSSAADLWQSWNISWVRVRRSRSPTSGSTSKRSTSTQDTLGRSDSEADSQSKDENFQFLQTEIEHCAGRQKSNGAFPA